jgi:hypothetical protein
MRVGLKLISSDFRAPDQQPGRQASAVEISMRLLPIGYRTVLVEVGHRDFRLKGMLSRFLFVNVNS